ncbi:hypothetical protein CVU37_01305 [candidate division BRC1 bacterium HGW-BRC1-1]|nr:MAG: hypothetical protein CVU37_01305 [candidate division BRC1 bacterium HGW-BRC1-1]
MPVLTRRHWLGGAALFLMAAMIYLATPVRPLTDSAFTLLLAENVLVHGDLALERYFPPGTGSSDQYQLERVGDHLRYRYPMAGALLSVPVAVAYRAGGWSVISPDGHYDPHAAARLQHWIASLLTAFFVVLAWLLILRSEARNTVAMATAALFAVGTTLWSNCAQAMWSDSIAMPFILGGLVMLVGTWGGEGQHKRSGFARVVAAASLIALGVLVRPVNAVPVAAVAVWLLWRSRRDGIVFIGVGAVWGIALALFHLQILGQVWPTYFTGPTMALRNFPQGATGLLFSASRGLFVFTPFVLVGVWWAWRFWRWVPRRDLLLLACAWVVAHWAFNACNRIWWGGFCYGPRLMTGAMPGLLLLMGLALEARVGAGLPRRWTGRALVMAPLAITALFAVWVQARAAAVPSVHTWNELPTTVDAQPGRAWDWSEPQFLTGLLPTPPRAAALPLPQGAVIWPGMEFSAKWLWYGWGGPESESMRWTLGPRAAIMFTSGAEQATTVAVTLRPYSESDAPVVQNLSLKCNGKALAGWALDDTTSRTLEAALPSGLMGRENTLVLEVNPVKKATVFGAIGDPRPLGVAVYSVRFIGPFDH